MLGKQCFITTRVKTFDLYLKTSCWTRIQYKRAFESV